MSNTKKKRINKNNLLKMLVLPLSALGVAIMLTACNKTPSVETKATESDYVYIQDTFALNAGEWSSVGGYRYFNLGTPQNMENGIINISKWKDGSMHTSIMRYGFYLQSDENFHIDLSFEIEDGMEYLNDNDVWVKFAPNQIGKLLTIAFTSYPERIGSLFAPQKIALGTLDDNWNYEIFNRDINHFGVRKEYLKPAISGDAVVNNVENPYTIEQIKQISQIIAYDDYFGKLELEVVADTYTANRNVLGTFTITFRATNEIGMFTDFVLSVYNIDITKPLIHGPSQLVISKDDDFSISNIMQNEFTFTDIDQNIDFTIDHTNFRANTAGTFTFTLKATDSHGNYNTHELIVIAINGPVFYNSPDALNIADLYKLDIDNLASIIAKDSGIVYSSYNIIYDTYSANSSTVGKYSVEIEYITEDGTITVSKNVNVFNTNPELQTRHVPWYESLWNNFWNWVVGLWNSFWNWITSLF